MNSWLRYPLFLLLLMIVCSSGVWGIGVYNDEGEFVHFVNNTKPEVDITIKDTTIPVIIDYASLRVNTQTENISLEDQLLPNQERTYNFTFDDYFGGNDDINNISAVDEVYHDMRIKSSSSGNVRLQGDPVSFFIEYDGTKPVLNAPMQDSFTMSGDALPITFSFDERISGYEVRLNGEVIDTVEPESRFLAEYQDSFQVNLTTGDVEEGRNSLEITARDLSGNQVTVTKEVVYAGLPLSVDLITRKQDDSLSYFYSSEHPNLFGDNLYTDSSTFTLTLQSSEAADCNFSDNRLTFGTMDTVTNQENMTTGEDGLHHTIEVSIPSGQDQLPLWAACQSRTDPSDIVYLHEMVGVSETLLTARSYDKDPVEITEFYPENVITSMPFSIQAFTNVEAACTANFTGSSSVSLEQNPLMTEHEATGVSIDGSSTEYTMQCIDRLYRKDTKTRQLEVDTNAGTQVEDYSPEYLSDESDQISLTLSESAECHYSLDPVPQTESSLNSLPVAEGSGINRNFSVSGLDRGENVIHLYCVRNGNVNHNEITVTYDPDGPSLSNLTFVSNGKESDFLGSTEEMTIEFDVESIIPMEQYFVELVFASETKQEIVPGTRATIVMNLTGLQNVRVRGQNEAGMNSSPISKGVQFDTTPPQLYFSEVSANTLKIRCSDAQSGCSEINYGTSQTSLSCSTGTAYSDNETIDVSESGYICSEAYDIVRNRQTAEKVLETGTGINDDMNTNETDDDTRNATDFINDTTNRNDSDTNNTVQQPFEPNQPSTPENEGSGTTTLVVAAAVFLVLAGIGSGGYYAYRKGYLNDQLERMGLLKPQRTTQKQTTSNTQSRNVQSDTSQNRNAYDSHVQRLNRFLDSTLSKGQDLFSKFDENSKGKHEEYEDTLMKRDKKDDAFYSARHGNKKGGESLTKQGKTIEEEAENFEDYYKKKKKKQNNKKES